eukprot:PITA_31038
MEKQGFAFFKAVKHFHPYLLKVRTKVIVPHPAVRALFVQKEMGERRGNWITALQEFDLEIKPGKIVRGQGLCRLATKALANKEGASEEPEAQSMQNAQVEFREEPLWINETLMYERESLEALLDPESWYYDICFYLTRGACPKHMDASRRRALRLKSNQYHLANDTLYRKNYDGIWLRCLEKDDVDHVLKEMHDGPAGDHYGGETTAHKILRVGYYWPTVFRDSHAYTRKCKARSLRTLQQHKYILRATDYFTKWTEAIPLRKVNKDEVISFIEKFIINRFGIPNALIFENASYFSSLKLTEFAIDKSIHIRYASNYYPQGNGVAKSSNKNLTCIIRKSVTDNQRNWHNALTNALWADRVTPKVALGNSPYFLVYGQEAILPPNVTLPSLQLSQASRGTPSALLQKRINQLVRLEELREKAKNKFINHQMIVKRWFDRHLAGDKDYQVGELVLKWDKLNEPKGKHTKFQHLWLGPFQVVKKIGQGTYRLKTLQGETEKLPVNGQHLKRYFE